jgi:adenylate kinase family enzyme
MRITVVGTTGSGKTTLAGRLAGALDLPHFELDAINWQPGWVSLNDTDQPEFIRRIEAAIGQPAWVMAGGYSNVRDRIWSRATHVIWLDYSRPVVMRRVIWRSVIRAIDRKELWPGTGNRENAAMWLTKEHPIRWAWDTYHRRQREFTARLEDPRFSHAQAFRLTHPGQAEPLVAEMAKARAGA